MSADGEGLADDVYVAERLAIGGDAAFATLAALDGGTLVVQRTRPPDADDEATLVVTGDAYPEGDGRNGFVLLGVPLPLGSTALELRVVDVAAIAPGAQVLVEADLDAGLLALDIEEEDADVPLAGFELELGAPGRYAIGIDLVHAASPSRAVLEVRIAEAAPQA